MFFFALKVRQTLNTLTLTSPLYFKDDKQTNQENYQTTKNGTKSK